MDAHHHQYRFVFGDLLCFPLLQDHEGLWKFDVKNDIGFYVGDEDSVKGGSEMPYSHSFLTRGNGHRVLISDIQLLQWSRISSATHSLTQLFTIQSWTFSPTGKRRPQD